MNKKNKNYVNGPQLHQAHKDWYESGKEEVPFIITTAVMQICERLGTKSNFKGYTYVDEMIAEGLVACISAVKNKKYDPYRYSNPFAYYTQIAYNEFRRVIKTEHKETYIKHKELEAHMINAQINGEVIEYESDNSGRLDALVKKFEGTKENEETS